MITGVCIPTPTVCIWACLPKGLDLLPDQGYWFLAYNHAATPHPQSVRAAYYYSSVGHNTVTVNGRSTLVAQGKTTLWADGDQFEAIRCAAPEMIGFLDYSSNPAALARCVTIHLETLLGSKV